MARSAHKLSSPPAARVKRGAEFATRRGRLTEAASKMSSIPAPRDAEDRKASSRGKRAVQTEVAEADKYGRRLARSPENERQRTIRILWRIDDTFVGREAAVLLTERRENDDSGG